MNRHFFYRNCWILALLAAIVLSAIAVICFDRQDRATLVGVALAAPFGFCYFAHQQKLAEIKLLKKLLTEFNERYDGLHKSLLALKAKTEPLTNEEEQTIVAYFNLCAEEYLFWSENYIPPTVWQSWCRGMREYLDDEPFKSRFDKEWPKKCYYGLTPEEIKRGTLEDGGGH